LPLSSRDPKAAAALIDELEADLKKKKESGEISPALAKQYDIQLEILRNDKVPDMEFIVFPGYFMCPGMLSPSLSGGSSFPYGFDSEPGYWSTIHDRHLFFEPSNLERVHCESLSVSYTSDVQSF
jgi:hypothetical protein